MFDRLMNVIKAMLNKGMSKMETPEVLAEQAQDQLQSSLKEVLDATAKAIANEKVLEQQIKKNNEELAMWEKRAATAVQRNNDDIAKQCLLKKHELNANGMVLSKQLEGQKTTTAALRARHAEIDAQLKKFMVQKDGMTQRARASDAVAKANEILSSKSGTGMDKYEQKIIEKEAKAAALRELSGDTPIEDKLKAMDQESAVEDDLAALKAQMGHVRLVVDKEAAAASSAKGEPKSKTVVDKSVPMVPGEYEDNLPIDVEEITDDGKK
jgi:phage shock protein A